VSLLKSWRCLHQLGRFVAGHVSAPVDVFAVVIVAVAPLIIPGDTL